MFSSSRGARSLSRTPQLAPSAALAPPCTMPVQAARRMRPPDRKSRLAHCAANTNGSRTGNDAMQPTPSTTRSVTPASAPSSVSDSGRGFAIKLSPTQTDSNSGSSSARRARPSISATVVAPKRAPRCGRVRPKVMGSDMAGLRSWDALRRPAGPSAGGRRAPWRARSCTPWRRRPPRPRRTWSG